MLVALAIIGVVTAVALVGQQSFTRSVLVSNTAYDVAITLRNAEVFGLSTQLSQASFVLSSGIDFNVASNNSFKLFSDTYPSVASGDPNLCWAQPNGSGAPNAKPGDCVYNSSNESPLSTYTLGNGITIKEVCAKKVGDVSSPYCWNSGTHPKQIDIVFSRPNTKAAITASTNGSTPFVKSMDSACITLQGPGSNPVFRYVYINALGQITASTSACP